MSTPFCVCGHREAAHLYPYGCASCSCPRYGLNAMATVEELATEIERLRERLELDGQALELTAIIAHESLGILAEARRALQGTRRWYVAHDTLAKRIDVALGREECVTR
jgi:hypothetical protein